MFIPGETVVHEFIVPIAYNQIREVIVTYEQNDHIVLEKKLAPANILRDSAGARLNYTLTQEESLLFASPRDRNCGFTTYIPYKVQINILTRGGARAVSIPMEGRTGIQHVREVMTND